MSKFKRLEGTPGSLQADVKSQSPGVLVKKCILVHSGPNGSEMTFESGDGEIKFDADRIKRIVENQNKKISELQGQYGGSEKMPLGAYDPVLDQHEDDSNDRIRGRMANLLDFEIMDVPKVGKDVACATTYITFIGDENVQKVVDGRIFHLSIGIDEESDTLGEVSTVITPAAPGAMLLSKKSSSNGSKPQKKGDSMPIDQKRLAGHKSRLAKLSELNKELTTLQSKGKEASVQLKAADKTQKITHRLTGFMRSGKLTPAEFKKTDIKKLAALSDEGVEILMNTYEMRQPVIDPTQKGSKDAVDFSSLATGLKKGQVKNLKAETKKALMKMGAKVKMSAEEEKDLSGPVEEEVKPGKDPAAVPGEGGDEEQLKHMWAKHMSNMKECLEKGDIEGAKNVHAEMSKHLEEKGVKHMSADLEDGVKSEDQQKAMMVLQGQVDELSTNLARLAGLVQEMTKSEEEEGKELAEGVDDGEVVEDEPDPENDPNGDEAKPKVKEDKH